MKKFIAFFKDEDGTEVVEWAVMAGLLIVLVIATIILMGGHVNTIFSALEGGLSTAATNATAS
jgi:Flp pilus assembly pilin Flp